MPTKKKKKPKLAPGVPGETAPKTKPRSLLDDRAPLNDNDTPITFLRDLMRQFVEERDWTKYHIPRNLAASIAVEAGELLELFQWHTHDEATARCKNDPAFRHAVGEELADVLMYCVSLANAMDLPIAQTVSAKMEKNRQKYPAHQVKGHYQRPLPNQNP